MKSIVEIEIDAPRQELFELFANPRDNPKWMHDLERYEPVSGDQGMPGSAYRLVPKEGDMVFLATVVERKFPNELRLRLETSGVHVAITGTLIALSPTRTKLISQEVFTFKGLFNGIFGPLFARGAIKAAHRRHIEDFRSFAEGQMTLSTGRLLTSHSI